MERIKNRRCFLLGAHTVLLVFLSLMSLQMIRIGVFGGKTRILFRRILFFGFLWTKNVWKADDRSWHLMLYSEGGEGGLSAIRVTTGHCDTAAALMMSHNRHLGVEEVMVAPVNTDGCSYAENFLVNLNNKYKFHSQPLVFFTGLFSERLWDTAGINNPEIWFRLESNEVLSMDCADFSFITVFCPLEGGRRPQIHSHYEEAFSHFLIIFCNKDYWPI